MAIVVAYDGSDSARKALDYALSEASFQETSIWLVYALPPEQVINEKNRVLRALSFSDISERYKEAISKVMREMLEEAERRIDRAGLEWEVRILNIGEGTGPDIVHFIEREKELIDMVVVGIHKRSPTGKAIFGSTAQHIILNSPCPVITINPGAR